VSHVIVGEKIKTASPLSVSRIWEKEMSHVTVSVGWEGKGKGVTCNGFWNFGGGRGKVSHVTVSGVFLGKGTGVTHVKMSKDVKCQMSKDGGLHCVH
jgi:hypothetical protein